MLLQKPVVAVRIGDAQSGISYSILLEKFQGVNYGKISLVLQGLASTHKSTQVPLKKTCVKMLLALANSHRERECIRYAVYKASGMSQTDGFENTSERADKVEQALKEADTIREAIDDIARSQGRALLESFGITSQQSSEEDSDVFSSDEGSGICHSPSNIPFDLLKMALERSKFNCFECFEELESQCSRDIVAKVTETLLDVLPDLNLNKEQEKLVVNSYQAFMAAKNDSMESERVARMANGDVTDSESDDPDAYVNLDVLSDAGKKMIIKHRETIKNELKQSGLKLLQKDSFFPGLPPSV